MKYQVMGQVEKSITNIESDYDKDMDLPCSCAEHLTAATNVSAFTKTFDPEKRAKTNIKIIVKRMVKYIYDENPTYEACLRRFKKLIGKHMLSYHTQVDTVFLRWEDVSQYETEDYNNILIQQYGLNDKIYNCDICYNQDLERYEIRLQEPYRIEESPCDNNDIEKLLVEYREYIRDFELNYDLKALYNKEIKFADTTKLIKPTTGWFKESISKIKNICKKGDK